jgi:hypothetical protein
MLPEPEPRNAQESCTAAQPIALPLPPNQDRRDESNYGASQRSDQGGLAAPPNVIVIKQEAEENGHRRGWDVDCGLGGIPNHNSRADSSMLYSFPLG